MFGFFSEIRIFLVESESEPETLPPNVVNEFNLNEIVRDPDHRK